MYQAGAPWASAMTAVAPAASHPAPKLSTRCTATSRFGWAMPGLGGSARVAQVMQEDHRAGRETDRLLQVSLAEVLVRAVALAGDGVEPEAVLGLGPGHIAVPARPPVAVPQVDDDRRARERVLHPRPGRVRAVDRHHVVGVPARLGRGRPGHPPVVVGERPDGAHDDRHPCIARRRSSRPGARGEGGGRGQRSRCRTRRLSTRATRRSVAPGRAGLRLRPRSRSGRRPSAQEPVPIRGETERFDVKPSKYSRVALPPLVTEPRRTEPTEPVPAVRVWDEGPVHVQLEGRAGLPDDLDDVAGVADAGPRGVAGARAHLDLHLRRASVPAVAHAEQGRATGRPGGAGCPGCCRCCRLD